MSVPHNADGFVIAPDGFAESSADILADFFAEHGDDPDEGDPEGWPREYDSIRVAIGPAYHIAESFDDLHDTDPEAIPF